MNTTKTDKISRFFKLLLPILITQVTLFSMSFFDTIMSGNSSPGDLAGVAIGVSIWTPISTGLTGILVAITTMVANLNGAKQDGKITPLVTQALYLAGIIAVVIIIIGIFSIHPILNHMNLDPKVHRVALHFLFALSFGILPLFLYTVIRQFIDGLGKTRTTMIITVISVPVNVILNYFLIFGKAGLPRLGGVGSGVASAITYWIIFGIAFYIIKTKKPFSGFNLFKKLPPISFTTWKSILKLGVPIGLSIFFEVSVFSVVTLLLSEFDTETIAAHTVAMNFASLLYMVPLSISMALTIAVGYEVGAKEFQNAKEYSKIGLVMAVSIASFFGIIIYLFRYDVAGWYTNDPSVQILAGGFLIFAVMFQLFDAIAAPIQGALRGYKDVNATLIMMILAYWVIALPVGYALSNTHLGAKGYWVGLIVGLGVSALTLSFRLVQLQIKKIKLSEA
ncbi:MULTISPECIES: MATE family efflux transporter [Bacillaceae]|uniref:Probable multidrug resistance protein NorM n=1 Tax=Gottfriedia luciferensis TaxID=178774 RepID=A0ABX2ZYS0_9BACI|nr:MULTISPECIES: MATE family efflux transporter [Bacillaceae]ODG93554.1 MATE family efflux transporter [Gottfriedia luciferensis]SFC41614.1 multidrug resistance protein, MATE family [Bacillus sp. UNCCL81]